MIFVNVHDSQIFQNGSAQENDAMTAEQHARESIRIARTTRCWAKGEAGGMLVTQNGTKNIGWICNVIVYMIVYVIVSVMAYMIVYVIVHIMIV